jgi:hypothetical protein
MTTSADQLEQRLARDLESLGERLGDDRLVRDLYAAIAGHALHPHDGEGRLAPSWSRAEELLNGAREAQGLAPLEGLAQSGREGELTDRARETLEQLGWDIRPRVTSGAQDPGHVDSPSEPHTHAPESGEWSREGHAEADAELRRRRSG